MAGRHRRTPAWRRLLFRLRRSDRAARTAALQAEVVALRATVRALRAELDAVWESAAAAARATDASRWALQMPLGQAAVTPDEVAETRAAAAATPAMAGVTSKVLDLRRDTTGPDQPEIVLADLPEFALLDPRRARDADVIDVSEPATASAADTVLAARRTA